MWISKKKWKELSNENSELKQRVKDMEVLSMAIEHANTGEKETYMILVVIIIQLESIIILIW